MWSWKRENLTDSMDRAPAAWGLPATAAGVSNGEIHTPNCLPNNPPAPPASKPTRTIVTCLHRNWLLGYGAETRRFRNTPGMKMLLPQSLMAGRDRFRSCGANCIWVNKIALKSVAFSDFPRNFFLAENFPSKNRLCAIFWVPRGIVPCVIRRPGWPLFIDKMHFVKSEYTIFFHVMYLVCIIYALYASEFSQF